MRRRENLFAILYPDEETFEAVSTGWRRDFVERCLSRVWEGWDGVLKQFSDRGIDPATLDWMGITQRERALAFLHFLQISELQSLKDPFTVTPEAPEFESLKSDRAMPPATDFAFHLRGGNARVALPVEAKYLESATDVARFCSDFSDKYLTKRASPLSEVAGLIGYLLSGRIADVHSEIESHLGILLEAEESFHPRPHWRSCSTREDREFACHWLLCTWEQN